MRHTGGGVSLVERFVVGVDMQRFSPRVTRRQLKIQRDLDRMLDEAADAAGVGRELWERRPEGDGEVAVLPADVDLLAVVRRFVSELDQRLADHNEDHSPETRIRLRVAMHIDVITRGALGYAGPALVVLQRLLDSAQARAALTESPMVNLAQIISESLYQKAVLPELGGLRPWQFKKVRVDLPAKGFHQTAYVYVPTGWSAPSADPPPRQPERPAQPSGVPFPISPTRPVPRPKPQRHVPDDPSEQPPPVPEPALGPEVRDLVRQVRKSLEEHEIERADVLTTQVLLEAAGRSRKGCLRNSDGSGLPDTLFTELDTAWAKVSGGVWGFRAQLRRIDGPVPSGSRGFRTLSVAFGWRADEDETVPRYAEFARRAGRGGPFYPTLRNPEREQYPQWYDEWSATAMSVYNRLQSGE